MQGRRWPARRFPSPPWRSGSARWWTCCRDPAVARSARDRRLRRVGRAEPRAAHHRPQAAGRARRSPPEQVIERLRPQLAKGRRHPDVPVGGAGPARRRPAAAPRKQFVLLGQDLRSCAPGPRLAKRCARPRRSADVSSDQDRAGPQADVVIDRVAAARLGVSVSAIDAALNNAFAQRQISIIYTPRNQYRVVLEVSPEAAGGPVRPRPDLRGRQRGRAGAALSVVAVKRHRAAGGAPPGPVSGRPRSASTSPPAQPGEALAPLRPRPTCTCRRRAAPSSPATRAG